MGHFNSQMGHTQWDTTSSVERFDGNGVKSQMSSLVQNVLDRFSGKSSGSTLIKWLYMLPGFTTRFSRCPVCGGKPDRVEFENGYSPLDHCADCDHVYTRVNPNKIILRQIYKDLSYWQKDKEHQGINNVEYGPQWKGFIDARMGAMQRHGVLKSSSLKFLEIGCSEGMLLAELGKHGHEATGCECNRETAELGIKTLGVEIMIGLFNDFSFPSTYYDVVASFHTIEHIPNLDQTFNKIANVLKPDGKLFIEVPTGSDEYPNTDHVHFFTDTSLKRLLERFFERSEVFPNTYYSASGKKIGSLYGLGLRPRH